MRRTDTPAVAGSLSGCAIKTLPLPLLWRSKGGASLEGQFTIILNQMAMFGLLLVVGIAAIRFRVLTADSLGTLSMLITRILLPCYIFSMVSATAVTLADLRATGSFLAGVACKYALLLGAAVLVAWLFRLPERTGNIHIACATFGNMGLVGVPLFEHSITSVYGRTCVSVYLLIEQMIVWTLCIHLCDRHNRAGVSLLAGLKKAINPVSVAMVLGVVFSFTGWRLPGLLEQTISGVGSTSKYLTFIYLGAMVCCIDPKRMVRKPTLYLLLAGKLLVVPLALYLLARPFAGPEAALILMIIAGLPCAVVPSLIARTNGADYAYATESLFLSTACSIFTVPLITWLALHLF